MPVDETAIRQWADHHECRSHLPLLVRRLIRETTPTLTSLRFPGNEAVDLAGLDGQAETEQATTWVPQGRSVWEMGCNQNPLTKANGDYQKRTEDTSEEERASTSFVFVTPRRWQAKDEWLAGRRAEGSWAAIHAYDAVDLETWLEEAPVTSRWIGELLGLSHPGLLTPDEWWRRWSSASAPPISRRLVATRRLNEPETLIQSLRDGNQVVPILADDRGEAIAFVIAALAEAGADDLLDRTLVVTMGNVVVPRGRNSRMIAIADLPDGQEPDFGDRRDLTIVRPYPKGRLDVQEALQLSHVPSEAFRDELVAMGFSRDDADGWALKTGHSVPVLRRRLSPDPEVRRPVWARGRASAKRLLPFAFSGSSVERENLGDVTVLQLLGEFEDGEVKRNRDELLALDDAPIARYGNVTVVVSQLDALFAIGPYIDSDDLDRFFQLVPELLGDRDPALDLPRDQWWMASVLGKGRNYSGALLSGLGDALCILAVHGAEICGKRLQTDLSHRASQVVRALMANANEERWLSIRGHLRALAEAAPYAFLDCLEDELRKPAPAIRAIMGVTDGAGSGECLRTNLLWALEILAWHPEHFSRAAGIIFDLQRFEINDNWSNSPASTAMSLFRAWMPATALNVANRLSVLRNLSEAYRMPAIDVCISLLPGGGPGFALHGVRPQWRALDQEIPDATRQDLRDAAIEASRLLLDMAPFSKTELEKALEVATRLHPEDLARLTAEVERWSAEASDGEKAELRHNLRRRDTAHAYQEQDDDQDFAKSLRRMERALEPDEAVARHRWLFESSYIEWRALVEEEEKLSWQERDARIRARRAEAIAEIEAELGADALLPFALSTKHPEIVAQILVPQDASPQIAARWAAKVLRLESSSEANAFLGQILWSAGLQDLSATVDRLVQQGVLRDEAQRLRLAEHLPGSSAGWRVASSLGADAEMAYWNSVFIRLWGDTPNEEAEYAVTKLLEAHRPRSAFSAAHLWPDRIVPALWERVLRAIAQGEEPAGPRPHSYELDRVLECLDNASDFPDDRIAGLELPFAPLLCSYGHRHDDRTLALHRELARDPALFVQLLTWLYGRRDGVIDTEFVDVAAEQRKVLADLAYHTLAGWNTVPGRGEDGEIKREDFHHWAEDALRQAADVDRREVAETHLGALLARFARRRSWDDWLPESVLDLLDRPEHGGLRERFKLGVSNARGVTTRMPYDGGAQERVLAGNYRELAARYGNSHPRVSALLTSIAEGYEWDARREDEQAALGERWRP